MIKVTNNNSQKDFALKEIEKERRRKIRRVIPVNDAALVRESWKIFQIMAEFVEGFEKLAQIRPSVSVFGSARIPPDHPYYKQAEANQPGTIQCRVFCGQWRRTGHYGGGQ